MPDVTRDQTAAGLGLVDPGGALVAYANPPAGQAVIRGRANDAHFTEASTQALGIALPVDSKKTAKAVELTIFRLGYDQWLAVHEVNRDFGQQFEKIDSLRAIDVGSARTRISLRGEAVRDLLAVGVKIDLRPKSFPVGTFAQTPAGNANTIIHASAIDRFDVYVSRSFASSWRVWLEHAGQEFGLNLAKVER